MSKAEPTAAELFEDYVPGWPHDAQLEDSLREQIADAIADSEGTSEQIAAAVMDELGLTGRVWIAIRAVDDPLFGAHQWHSCPKCGHTGKL